MLSWRVKVERSMPGGACLDLVVTWPKSSAKRSRADLDGGGVRFGRVGVGIASKSPKSSSSSSGGASPSKSSASNRTFGSGFCCFFGCDFVLAVISQDGRSCHGSGLEGDVSTLIKLFIMISNVSARRTRVMGDGPGRGPGAAAEWVATVDSESAGTGTEVYLGAGAGAGTGAIVSGAATSKSPHPSSSSSSWSGACKITFEGAVDAADCPHVSEDGRDG